AASPSWTRSPVRWTAKSTIVVVPPQAAARVPVSNVSDAFVPPNGSSMCVWQSTAPGITYLPVASTTRSAVAARSAPRLVAPGRGSAATCSPSTSTSAGAEPVGPTTVPPRISVCAIAWSPFEVRCRAVRSRPGEVVVRVGAPVPVELPPVAHHAQQVHVEVAHDQLLLVVVAGVADERALGVDEVRRAVEVVVAQVLDTHAVDRADVVLVGHRRRRLLEPPQVIGEPAARRARVEHDLRAVQPERAPPL